MYVKGTWPMEGESHIPQANCDLPDQCPSQSDPLVRDTILVNRYARGDVVCEMYES